ncbi:hypothetical protein [Candidatus Avelusimicrobium sp.]
MNLKMKVTSVFTAFLMMFSSCLPVAAQEKQTKFEKLKEALRHDLQKVNEFYAGPYGKAIVGVSIGALYVVYRREKAAVETLKRELFDVKYNIAHELERVPLGSFGDEYVEAYGKALAHLQENYLYHAPEQFIINGVEYTLREGQENLYLREAQKIVNAKLEKYKPNWDMFIVRGDTPEITMWRMVDEITKEIREGIVKNYDMWPIIFKKTGHKVTSRGMKAVIGSVGKNTLWLLPLALLVSSNANASETQSKIERIYQNPELIFELSEEEFNSSEKLAQACQAVAAQVHELAQAPQEEIQQAALSSAKERQAYLARQAFKDVMRR